MTSIIPIPVETTMRRSITGAMAGDPVLDERRRRVRRPTGRRSASDGARLVRTPAAEC